MNLLHAAKHIDRAAAILRESNDEADLRECIRTLEAAVNASRPGADRNCCNIRLCDAYAALDAHRRDVRNRAGISAWYPADGRGK